MDIILSYIGHHTFVISLYMILFSAVLCCLYIFTRHIEILKIVHITETIICLMQTIFWTDVAIIVYGGPEFLIVLSYMLAVMFCLLTAFCFKKRYAK